MKVHPIAVLAVAPPHSQLQVARSSREADRTDPLEIGLMTA